MYTDDTSLLFSSNDLNELMSQVNREISKVLRWFNANKLMVNEGKTKYMILYRQARKIPDSVPLLLICNEPTERVFKFKFLDTIVDCNLEIDGRTSVVKKLAKYVPIFYRLKKLFDINIMSQLYHGLVLPNMNYCISAWWLRVIA